MVWLTQSYKDWGLSHWNNLDLPGDAFSQKVKAKRKGTMTDVKLNPDSDDVGTKIRSLGFQLPWVWMQ